MFVCCLFCASSQFDKFFDRRYIHHLRKSVWSYRSRLCVTHSKLTCTLWTNKIFRYVHCSWFFFSLFVCLFVVVTVNCETRRLDEFFDRYFIHHLRTPLQSYRSGLWVTHYTLACTLWTSKIFRFVLVFLLLVLCTVCTRPNTVP